MTNIVILASSSPRRTELLTKAGIAHTIRVSDVDETPLKNENPMKMVERLSCAKASVVAEKIVDLESAFVIAADTTVVTAQKKNLGKPESVAEAISMIQALQGKKHHVFTAYTVLKFSKGKIVKRITRTVRTDVFMKKMTRAQIIRYVDQGECMDKAGAYAAQGFGMVLIERISGSYTNVVGLPTAEVVRDLEKLGYGRTSRR